MEPPNRIAGYREIKLGANDIAKHVEAGLGTERHLLKLRRRAPHFLKLAATGEFQQTLPIGKLHDEGEELHGTCGNDARGSLRACKQHAAGARQQHIISSGRAPANHPWASSALYRIPCVWRLLRNNPEIERPGENAAKLGISGKADEVYVHGFFFLPDEALKITSPGAG